MQMIAALMQLDATLQRARWTKMWDTWPGVRDGRVMMFADILLKGIQA